ncbi:protein phosphatase 2C [Oesophagostomum dentatum]|uniref:protein-serine/threonine phosphatase n=2 Tax=Oesophagostomum dentatum TaxID=61180 RepID=A0A0B1T244_OESDE|nr:protein phosphatase 2C [Oesophagostomum dentatum]
MPAVTFYRQGYIIGRNPKNRISLEEPNDEQENCDDKCQKGKRQSKSPTQEPAKRAKTEGNGSVLSMLIADGEEENGAKANAEDENIEKANADSANANDGKDTKDPEKEESADPMNCDGNGAVKAEEKREPAAGDAAEVEKKEQKEDEANANAAPVIKTKQKKTPINAEKKVGAAEDGLMDDEDSEDDSDFNEAEEEAEDECEEEDECDSDDDGEDVAISGGLETPGEDSGTTACVCLINKQRIVVANSGDSRAVLCRDGTAIDLSLDHKPEDDIERTRIVNAGGFVNEDGRVNGGLNLSRAFGDHSYKKNTDLSLRDQMITALPDVKVEALQPNDEFLIVVANSGDSRAVLCRDGTAIDLSLDHKPEDDIERTRIVNAGGFVNEDGRVNGGLNLSRAFGDHSYKKNTDLSLRDQMITALPDVKVEALQPNDEFLVIACDGIWVNGGLNLSRAFGDHSYKKNTDLSLRDQMITALPDVKVEALQPNDEFLVIACDGIWNSLNSQQVVDFIRERLKQGKSCVEISEELCDHCLAPSTAGDGTGCDNMTVIITTITH